MEEGNDLIIPLFLAIINCVHLLLHIVDHFIKSSEKHIITTERGRRSSVVTSSYGGENSSSNLTRLSQ